MEENTNVNIDFIHNLCVMTQHRKIRIYYFGAFCQNTTRNAQMLDQFAATSERDGKLSDILELRYTII